MRWVAWTFTSIVMAVLVISPAIAQDESDSGTDKVLDIQKVVSDGGIEAWLVEDHSVPIIAMNFSFKDAGAAQNNAEQQGLARMLSNTLDEGAGELDSQAFQKELTDLSISLGFSSGRDDFGGSVKTLTKHSTRAFELLTLALTQPRFDPEPVERMRKANQSRIRSSLTNPDWIAARFMNDVAYAGHPYAMNSGGTLSSLEAITPDDLRAYHKAMIGKNNLVVSVAGDIKADALKTLLDDVFGALPDVTIPETPDIALQNAGSVTVFEKDIPQTIIEIVQPGIDRLDPDYQTAQVMNYVLGSSGFGSRLTEEIREKRGLTYGIHTYFYDLDHVETLAISTSTKNENVSEMLPLIRAEFDKLKTTPITDDELTDAKAYLIGSLPLSLTSTDKIAGLLQSIQVTGLPIDYLEKREEALEAVTADDVHKLAQKLLNPEAFVTVLVGQPEGIADDATIRKEIPNVE